MPLYDFTCDKCEDKIEKIVSYDTYGITCDCGGMYRRQISMPMVNLDGTDPGFPGAYAKWEKTREDRTKSLRKKSWYDK